MIVQEVSYGYLLNGLRTVRIGALSTIKLTEIRIGIGIGALLLELELGFKLGLVHCYWNRNWDLNWDLCTVHHQAH